MKNRKLKNYLLFPKIQLKFLGYTLLTYLFTAGIFLYQLRSSFENLISLGVKAGLNEEHSYFKLLRAQETLILNQVLIALFIAIIVTMVVNFVITHRALGPFYRLKVFFGSYQKGSGEKIRFRDTDYFKSLEDDINKAID